MFLRLLRAEWTKLRRSPMILVLFCPLLLIVFGAGNFVHYREEWTRPDWVVLHEQCFILFPTLLLPLAVALITALLARIENDQNSWKQLLAFPVSRGAVYAAKLIVCLLLVLLLLVIFSLGFVGAGLLVGAQGAIPFMALLLAGGNGFISLLPMLAILFFIAFRFSHIGVPLGIGTGLSMPTLFAANSEALWVYDPWTYPVMAFLGSSVPKFDVNMELIATISLAVFMLVTAAGYLEFRRRDFA